MSEDTTEQLAHGLPLWVNVRALAQAIDKPKESMPCAYLEKQAIDDVCVLLRTDRSTVEGQTIKLLQDAIKARNKEIRTLRQLYCAVSAANEEVEK